MSQKTADRREIQAPETAPEANKEERIKINGFGQVLEMLQAADPSFRESLLRRIAQRDPGLARNLRAQLANH